VVVIGCTWLSGWLVTNLEVEILPERTKANENTDNLLVRVVLKKRK